MILKRGSRKSQKGQGLTEYAIIIALVAIVCVIILGLVGLAATRGYGLVAGALGAKKEIGGTQNYVRFSSDTNPPQCGTIRTPGHPLQGHRGFYAQFDADPSFSISDFTAATDVGLVPDIHVNGPLGPGHFIVNMDLTLMNIDYCPRSLVIQTPKSRGGETVAYTVLQQDWP